MKLTQAQRTTMFGYWKDISPNYAYEGPERDLRIGYASTVVGRELTSWNDLTTEEAATVIGAMRKYLGREENPASDLVTPDALEIIENIARELHGEHWYSRLLLRLKSRPYFHEEPINRLSRWQSHQLIEELLDYWERKLNPEACTMRERKARKEELRKRFSHR
jgi:hypothetical protein